MKTKQEEIAIIEKTIAELGRDSYLGPWLHSICGELKANIASDHFPTITLSEAANEIKAFHAKAEEHRDKIVAYAKQRSNDIEKLANDAIERARAAIISAQQALLSIEERL